ncbi:MAG TPA: DUF4440 domain-containing protein [Clostridia bacterium]|nr:DUF4440 domain-containing protein [Clostridia bacterium]
MRALRRLSLLAVCFACLILTCLALAQSGPEAVLFQADRNFNKATQEKHIDGWMEFMADNVVLDRERPVSGKDAVRAALAPQWSDPNFKLTWEPIRGELFPDSTMGYTSGRWTRETVRDGQPAKLEGNYLTVWRKQADGSYKVVWDGGAADPRPRPTQPTGGQK